MSLDEYIARMPEGQKRIYYLGGPDFASITKSPNLEIFRRRGLEVLFLTDPIDEFAITSLTLVSRASSSPRSTRPTSSCPRRRATAAEPEAEESNGQGERLRPRARPVPRRARGLGSRRSASRSG